MAKLRDRCFYQYLNAFMVLVIVLSISSLIAFHFSEMVTPVHEDQDSVEHSGHYVDSSVRNLHEVDHPAHDFRDEVESSVRNVLEVELPVLDVHDFVETSIQDYEGVNEQMMENLNGSDIDGKTIITSK